VASHEYRRYVLGLQSGDGEADRVVDVTLERHRVAREERRLRDTWADVRATSPVTLVRSMAYLPGWRATALNTTTGKSEALKVSRNGLIQQVTVPSGEWTIISTTTRPTSNSVWPRRSWASC